MSINEISITRALAELKLVESKINKKINENEFVYINSKKSKSHISNDGLLQLSKSGFQSVIDLINYRNKLKNGIILSNSRTMVKLNGEEMTVAEVIEKKNVVEFYKNLLNKLKMKREGVINQMERHNQSMENDLQKILEINFGKATNLKTNSDDIESISKSYREHNKAEIIDGIGIDKKINEIEELVNQYETEANFVLSESNAITKIRV